MPIPTGLSPASPGVCRLRPSDPNASLQIPQRGGDGVHPDIAEVADEIPSVDVQPRPERFADRDVKVGDRYDVEAALDLTLSVGLIVRGKGVVALGSVAAR